MYKHQYINIIIIIISSRKTNEGDRRATLNARKIWHRLQYLGKLKIAISMKKINNNSQTVRFIPAAEEYKYIYWVLIVLVV